jgi:hypothetical protein
MASTRGVAVAVEADAGDGADGTDRTDTLGGRSGDVNRLDDAGARGRNLIARLFLAALVSRRRAAQALTTSTNPAEEARRRRRTNRPSVES